MDIAKYVKLELTWEPGFCVWKLKMEIPSIHIAKPIKLDYMEADDYSSEIPVSSELFMEQGHILVFSPHNLFAGKGYGTFSDFILHHPVRIFNAITNEELASLVLKYCLQIYNNDGRFRHHCDHPYQEPNAALTYTGKVETGEQLKYEMPGLEEKVRHPLLGNYTTVERCIVNLNDSFKWSREQIADWLETLDVDLTFKVKQDG